MRIRIVLLVLAVLLAVVPPQASAYISENSRQGLAPISAEFRPEPTSREPASHLGFSLRFLEALVRSGISYTDPFGLTSQDAINIAYSALMDSNIGDARVLAAQINADPSAVECVIRTLRSMASGKQASLYSAQQLQLLERAYIALKWPIDQISFTASQLVKESCDSRANEIFSAIGGDEIITIQLNPELMKSMPKIQNIIGPVKISSSGTVDNWGYHKAVKKGGRIYDLITGPKGLSVEEYKSLFTYQDLLTGW